MKRSPVLALVVLSAVFTFGRTVSDEEIARAVLRTVRAHPGMPNPDSVQVSNVVVTNEGVCMQYRVASASGGIREGYAVYKTDKELVYIDNSWIWDSSCLVGKYGQRRQGKDVTQSVSAALDARKKAPTVAVAHVAKVQAASVVPMVAAPAAVTNISAVQPAVTATAPSAVDVVVPAAAIQNATVAAPIKVQVSAASVPLPAVPQAQVAILPAVSTAPQVAVSASATSPQSVISAVPVRPVDVPAAPLAAPVVTITSPPIVIVQTAPSVPVAAPAPVPVQVPVPIEAGTVRGVTIADPYGALGKATPTAAGAVVQESLADAARRLRKLKQQ